MRQNISGQSPWENLVGYSRAVRMGASLERTDLENVVRTRMAVTGFSHWPDLGRAHGEVFGDIRPAATMAQGAALIDPQPLVETEAEALLP